jgi:hypothetical protein
MNRPHTTTTTTTTVSHYPVVDSNDQQHWRYTVVWARCRGMSETRLGSEPANQTADSPHWRQTSLLWLRQRPPIGRGPRASRRILSHRASWKTNAGQVTWVHRQGSHSELSTAARATLAINHTFFEKGQKVPFLLHPVLPSTIFGKYKVHNKRKRKEKGLH